MLLNQSDFGAGYSGNYTFPLGTTEMRMWLQGPGAGGGAGSSSAAGGGGGSGARNYICLTGDLGGKVITINLPIGGTKGVHPCGNGNLPSGHSTVAFDNGWTWISGAGNFGYGGSALPGPGGPGGNAAVTGSMPSYITSCGQFNLGAFAGMDGTFRLWGYGGNQGDAGGGGQGGWLNTDGGDGQGGYAHIEAIG